MITHGIPPVEQKATTIGLIIYKHSTCTKLCHPWSQKDCGEAPKTLG